jgi:hypothetical protein
MLITDCRLLIGWTIADRQSLNIEYSAIGNLRLTNKSRNLQSAICIV